MPYKFNPFTGNLDYYESGGTVPDPLTLTRTLTVDQTDNETGLILQASPAQTANLQEWQDSAAAVLLKITPEGYIHSGDETEIDWYGINEFAWYKAYSGAVGQLFWNITDDANSMVRSDFVCGDRRNSAANVLAIQVDSPTRGGVAYIDASGTAQQLTLNTPASKPISLQQNYIEQLGITASGNTHVVNDFLIADGINYEGALYNRNFTMVDDVTAMSFLLWNGRADITDPEVNGHYTRFDFATGNYAGVGPYGGMHIYAGSAFGDYDNAVFVFAAGGSKLLTFNTDVNSPGQPPIRFAPANSVRLNLEWGGRVGIGDATAAAGQLHINGQTDEPTLIVEGAAAQTSNLQEWRDSAGAWLAQVRSDGKVQIGGSDQSGTTIDLIVARDINSAVMSGIINPNEGDSASAQFYMCGGPWGSGPNFALVSFGTNHATYPAEAWLQATRSSLLKFDIEAAIPISFRQGDVEKLGIDANGDVQVADDLYVTGTAYGTLDEADYLHGWETYPNSGDLLFDNSTHIFSFDDNYYYRYKGERVWVDYQDSGTTVDLDDTTYRDNSSSPALQTNTLYFIYFKDATAQPYWSDNAWDLREHVPICTIFWNGSAGAMIYECHGARRDIEWHINAHSTIGTRYKNDGGFAQTLPTTATDNQIQIETGTIFDEDIQTTPGQRTTCRKWYEVSAGVYTFTDADDANTYPYLWNAGTSRIQYPESDNSYTLADVTNSQFIPLWVYATPDTAQAIYVVTPSMTAPYNTLASARNATQPSLGGVGQEFKLLYRWIYRGDGEYQEGLDYRTVSSLPAGGSTTTAASSVTLIPVGNVSSTNVQAAIEELDTEKAITAAGVPTGGTTSQVLKKNSNSDYDMSWSTVAGTGDVVGPASAVSGNFASYNGTTGKSIQDSGESKASLLLAMWPVGAIYTSVVSTNPGTLFGGTWAAFGTGRVLVGIDAGDTDFDTVEETGGAKTVASAGTNAAEAAHTHSVTSNVTSAANTGNEAAHTHTYTQVPNHVHDLYELRSATTGSAATNLALSADASSTRGSGAGYQTANPTGGVASGTTAAGSSHNHSSPALTNNAVTSGGGSSHNHAYTGTATSVVQPYIVVYMWKRTA